jgi:hypothetical protein
LCCLSFYALRKKLDTLRIEKIRIRLSILQIELEVVNMYQRPKSTRKTPFEFDSIWFDSLFENLKSIRFGIVPKIYNSESIRFDETYIRFDSIRFRRGTKNMLCILTDYIFFNHLIYQCNSGVLSCLSDTRFLYNLWMHS